LRKLSIALGALVLAAGAPLFAQDPPVVPPLPGPPGGPGGGEQEARQEMIELFQSVETRLKEIDELLYEASSGRRGLDGADESVIGELLNASSGKSQEVLGGIDRILEIAEQFGQGQGGSGGSVKQAMGSGDSPLDGQPQGEQGQKEQAPEVENSEQPGEQEQQGQPDQPGSDRPGGQHPDDPGEEPGTRPENRDATSQPPGG
jgi:hypothetical protein